MFGLFKRNPKASAAGATAAVLLSISALIKPWEGLETKAYQDIVGVWTACYGETQGIRPGDTFTPQQCDQKLLIRVTEDYYKPLTRCILGFETKPVGYQAAFISLAYNIGTGKPGGKTGACNSTAARLSREGKLEASCHAMTLFNKAGGRVVKGLQNRRQAELKVCLQGVK